MNPIKHTTGLFMMRRISLPFVLSLFLLISCTAPNGPSSEGVPEFRIMSAKQEDVIAVANENGATILDVQSFSGIGSATIELVSGTISETMMVRLHTKGLEEFRLFFDETTVAASVPSGDGFGDANERILSAGEEIPITSLHPLWMNVEIISNQATQRIPLEIGYFEITFPDEFSKDAQNSFEISWVDFFR